MTFLYLQNLPLCFLWGSCHCFFPVITLLSGASQPAPASATSLNRQMWIVTNAITLSTAEYTMSHDPAGAEDRNSPEILGLVTWKELHKQHKHHKVPATR